MRCSGRTASASLSTCSCTDFGVASGKGTVRMPPGSRMMASDRYLLTLRNTSGPWLVCPTNSSRLGPRAKSENPFLARMRSRTVSHRAAIARRALRICSRPIPSSSSRSATGSDIASSSRRTCSNSSANSGCRLRNGARLVRTSSACDSSTPRPCSSSITAFSGRSCATAHAAAVTATPVDCPSRYS